MWRWLLVYLGIKMMNPPPSAPNLQRLVVPAGGFTRVELVAAAAAVGVPVADLMVAIVMCSERARSVAWANGYEAELRAIAATLYTRTRYPNTFSGHLVDVALTGKVRTGEPGGQFATSQVPQGDLLALLLTWAAQVRAEQAAGITRGEPLAYHHHKGAKAAETNEKWEGRGYVRYMPSGVRPDDATFFKAGPNRARTMS